MSSLDSGRFDVLTFDCYGTLIDWEAGILAGAAHESLEPLGIHADDELARTVRRAERGRRPVPTGPTARCSPGLRPAWAASCGVEPGAAELEAFGASVPDWPAFPDSADALARLQRDTFAWPSSPTATTTCSPRRTRGSASPFDDVITAQQVGAYKPSRRNFEVAFERLGCPASGSCTWPRACSTTMCPPSAWA